LQVTYKNRKLERICTDYKHAQKLYSVEMADKIHLRRQNLESADNIEHLLQYAIGRCHPLSGNLKDKYAMDLVHPFRLVFTVAKKSIQIACIEDITDYH